MDSFITWEGVVATLALLVSLYNLQRARRAPALARQRELRDQLRVLLDASVAEIDALQEGLRKNALKLPSGLHFVIEGQKIAKIRERLDNLDSAVVPVESHLAAVGAYSDVVTAARQRNAARQLLGSDAQRELPEDNLPLALQDLDVRCVEAAQEISYALKKLNQLESR